MPSIMSRATVIVKNKIEGNATVQAPGESQPITINPVFQSFFSIGLADAQMETKINEINDFLGASTPEDLLLRLKDIKFRMGESHPSLDKVHRYITLKKKARELSTASRALEV